MPKLFSKRGKFTIDKLIAYHERRTYMCQCQSDRGDEAEFHNNAVALLKSIKEGKV